MSRRSQKWVEEIMRLAALPHEPIVIAFAPNDPQLLEIIGKLKLLNSIRIPQGTTQSPKP
jgi:hypothetical protein